MNIAIKKYKSHVARKMVISAFKAKMYNKIISHTVQQIFIFALLLGKKILIFLMTNFNNHCIVHVMCNENIGTYLMITWMDLFLWNIVSKKCKSRKERFWLLWTKVKILAIVILAILLWQKSWYIFFYPHFWLFFKLR